ncbi:MAG: c-type cytochrome [Candidatus Melainabacteria bacterium]|nr:c-type cytochrome [Candidatus Melainabacteria bacterium]
MKKNWKSIRLLLLLTIGGIIATVLLEAISIDVAAAAPSGDKIFTANCAACHMGGKNIIDPKKPVVGSKKLASKDLFKALLSKSTGGMPAFSKIAENDAALEALYAYVKSLK